jgi:hypothetical protein
MAQDLSVFRPSRIWKRMPADRRLSAAELFWGDEQAAEQQIEAISAIAAHMKFRAKSVSSLPLEKKARYLATVPAISDAVAARALVSYHLGHQRAMMGAFLDALAIAHEDGLIQDDKVPKPEIARLRTAAAALAGSYPQEDVALYLSTLVSQDPETWGELAELSETGVSVTR